MEKTSFKNITLFSVFKFILFNFISVAIIACATLADLSFNDIGFVLEAGFRSIVLTVLLAYFILTKTLTLNNFERLIQYGTGATIFLFSSIAMIGFNEVLRTNLLICILVFVFFLYKGKSIFRI
jgi:hypothetical protein